MTRLDSSFVVKFGVMLAEHGCALVDEELKAGTGGQKLLGTGNCRSNVEVEDPASPPRPEERRSKRRSMSGDCPDEGGDVGDCRFYGGDLFGGGFGPSGGGGGGGGGGWNFGGPNLEDNTSSRFGPGSGFALDFVYEVMCWIALSNCVHFAFKKMLRSLAVEGVGDAAREKVPIRLTTMC
ncbi:keratin, type II cytoskeletal 68 kDa, component IB [Eucalyptus grandis]|uniref:keratin, type II cytoskeletal 68 kDa, component IB n=1 Tax=Eucalyptus grandis TaxID=71139 RepID=UPI00192EBF8A|nr:keratin, type II cytoskeletal 68 kDa, component IB [Eucalyptus grandis]